MIQRFLYEFLGYGSIPSNSSITIFSDDGEHFIFFENGRGTSVTNASEQLATEIVNKFGYDPEECRFFETYSEEDGVDEIQYIWKSTLFPNNKKRVWEANSPRWSPAPEDIVKLFKEN